MLLVMIALWIGYREKLGIDRKLLLVSFGQSFNCLLLVIC